jgi:simple sugar transport system permease protein
MQVITKYEGFRWLWIGQLLSQLGVDIPPQLLASVPYILTVVVVAGLVGRVRGPASSGQPYEQG